MNILQDDEEEDEPDSLGGEEDYTFKRCCSAINPGPRKEINDNDFFGENGKKKECQIM